MRQVDKEAQARYLDRLRLIREGAAANPFESTAEQQARIERARRDVRFFVEYYLSHYATSQSADFQIKLANRVAKSQTCRELIRWGRGLAKSVWADTIIPLWLWVRGEDIYMVIVGNNYAKAVELLSDVQAEFEANPRLIHDFGEQQLRGSWESGNFSTRDRKFRGVALGMRESPRGLRKQARRPNYIVCDDLEDRETVNNERRQDAIVTWIESDLIPTMDGNIRRYLHPNNDFAPRTIQNELERRHPTWHVDTVKAYDKATYAPAWPQKYSPTYYRELEDDLGVLAVRAEYLHEPIIQGKIFKPDMIQWADPPKLNTHKIIVGHWDVAYSGNNDYNAIKVWGLNGINFWHIKAFCRQCKMEDAVRWMYDYEDTLPGTVVVHWRVEAQFWGDPVMQAIETVRAERGRWLNILVVDRSKSGKFDRILTMCPYYQNGRIYYSSKEYADNDMQAGLKQLYGIEPKYTGHDDGPDADQQAIEYLAHFVSYTRASGETLTTGESRRCQRL